MKPVSASVCCCMTGFKRHFRNVVLKVEEKDGWMKEQTEGQLAGWVDGRLDRWKKGKDERRGV